MVEFRGELARLGLVFPREWVEQLKIPEAEAWPLGWQLFVMVGMFQIQSLVCCVLVLRPTKQLAFFNHLLCARCYSVLHA